MGHLVVGTAHLEAKDRLQILTLHEDFVAQTIRQVDGAGERSHFDDIVDTRGEDEPQILQ